MDLSVCVTDEDYEAWRAVRSVVEPETRTLSLAEMRAADSHERLLLLASDSGRVVGCGIADRSDTAGAGFVMPRVLSAHRRRGAGTALLDVLARHCQGLGVERLASGTDDDGSLAFATRFGFVEVDREVEQVRRIGAETAPPPAPTGVEVVDAADSPGLWADCYESFGREVLADFALYTPLEISPEAWRTTWLGQPMWLALADGEVVGCAGLHLDDDRPERAENALTAVTAAWRGRGLAAHLKRVSLHWAATHGLAEVYTWTQVRNTPMVRLNEHLGYVTTHTSVTLSRDLPWE